MLDRVAGRLPLLRHLLGLFLTSSFASESSAPPTNCRQLCLAVDRFAESLPLIRHRATQALELGALSIDGIEAIWSASLSAGLSCEAVALSVAASTMGWSRSTFVLAATSTMLSSANRLVDENAGILDIQLS